MTNTGLNSNQIADINKIFVKYEQIDKVILYGSRAMGTYNKRSDIDLVVLGSNIDRTLIINMKFDLEELNIPYFVDLQDYKTINNKNLIEHINRVGIDFYKKQTTMD
jgi:predicted nucleotidyltransferase